jgi:hypothetical protein
MTRFSTLVGLSVLALGATHCGVPEVGSMYAAGIATAETPAQRQLVGNGEYAELDLIGMDARIIGYLDRELAEGPSRGYRGGAASTENVPLAAVSVITNGERVDYTAIAETSEVNVHLDEERRRTIHVLTELESDGGTWRYAHATLVEQPGAFDEQTYWAEYELHRAHPLDP